MKRPTQEIKLYINGELVYKTSPTPSKLEEDRDTYITYLREILTGYLRRVWLRSKGIPLTTMIEWDMAFNCFFNTIPNSCDKPHRIETTIDGKRYTINLHDSRLGVIYQPKQF